MIIDFEKSVLKHSNGTEQDIVTPHLRAMNLQVIENQLVNEPIDFKINYI